MAEEKVDLSTAGGDGSREAGTGIGMVGTGVKDAEAGFLDAAANALDNLGVLEEEEPKKKKRPVEEVDDGDLEEQAPEGADSEDEEQDEAPDEIADGEADGADEEEDDAKVSIRLNGKKADLEDVLDHVGATVVVNGEEIDVTGSELIKGYQRGKDYSDKTTELKHLKDEITPYAQMVAFAKEDPQFLDHVQSYFKNGPLAHLTGDPLIRTTDAQLSKMMDRDSAEYDPEAASKVVKLRSEWQSKAGERQQVEQRAAAEHQRMVQEWTSNQIQMAQQAINAIGQELGYEDTTGNGEYVNKSDKVLESLHNWGFNDQEISGQAMVSSSDARIAVMAYKAAEFDRMVAESDTPRVTLGKKRKKLTPPRSQKTGSGTRKTSGKRQQRDSFRKASKEQTTEGWISALEKRLG